MNLNIQQRKGGWWFLIRGKFIVIIDLSPYDNEFVGFCCFLNLDEYLCSAAPQMKYYTLKVQNHSKYPNCRGVKVVNNCFS